MSPVSEQRIGEALTVRNKLKRSRKIFGYLCTAIVDLNNIFALPAFILLSLRLISTSICLCITIIGLMSNNVVLIKLVPATATFCLVGVLSILLVCIAADLPVKQVNTERDIEKLRTGLGNNICFQR